MSESASGEAGSSNTDSGKEVPECPTCGRDDFKSEYGMKQHHGKAHGESITITLTCEYCGEDFEKIESQQNAGRFCSTECMGNWNSENKTGENAYAWDGGKAELECEECGDTYKVKKNKTDWSRFCSNECKYKERGRKWTGENNPSWVAGEYDTNYGGNWREQRRKARKRDQYRCQICGDTSQDLPREPDVHHIKRVGWFRDNYDSPEWHERANDLENLITLCRPCHMEWEGIPVLPIRG